MLIYALWKLTSCMRLVTVYDESAGRSIFQYLRHIVFLKKPSDKILSGQNPITCMQRSGKAICWVIVLNQVRHHIDYATAVWTHTTVLHTDHTPLFGDRIKQKLERVSWGPMFQVDLALLLLSLTLPRRLGFGFFLWNWTLRICGFIIREPTLHGLLQTIVFCVVRWYEHLLGGVFQLAWHTAPRLDGPMVLSILLKMYNFVFP